MTEEKIRAALEALYWSDIYGVADDLYANGCWHGFKPASKCPNQGCEKRAIQVLVEQALGLPK